MTMASPVPPFIAATAQRRRQLLLQHRLDEAADAAAQTGLDRVEPSLTRKQPLGARRCRAILVHGVVSPGASTPGFGCRVSTGDYVTSFPTTSRTGPGSKPARLSDDELLVLCNVIALCRKVANPEPRTAWQPIRR